METYFNRTIYRKRKRFLIQTGFRKITANFYYPDSTSKFETRLIPAFDNFVQVICNSRYECVQMLHLQKIDYTAIHEVIHPLFIDGVEIHEELFNNVPPNIRN